MQLQFENRTVQLDSSLDYGPIVKDAASEPIIADKLVTSNLTPVLQITVLIVVIAAGRRELTAMLTGAKARFLLNLHLNLIPHPDHLKRPTQIKQIPPQ
jgi:hypothetical protein